MNLFSGRASQSLFGGEAPDWVTRLLQDAAAATADPVRAESLLWTAKLTAPDCLPVYFALYKFYFYKGRLADAERCARDGLATAAKAAGLADNWARVVPGDADFSQLGPARFWLFTLKALAFIRLRRGDTAEADALLRHAARLDPDDMVGAGVIRSLRDGSR